MAFEPGRRHSCTLLSGLPVRDYVADVILTPDGGGTEIAWHSTFEPKVPGTGWLYRAVLERFITDVAGRLATASTTGRPQVDG